jgi:hypothetical protein
MPVVFLKTSPWDTNWTMNQSDDIKSNMDIVYRLRNDISALKGMQDASLHHDFLGLRITHGLIGTEEWWKAIESGVLELHTVRGVIRGLWLGQYNSGPAEFKIQLKNGSFYTEMCEQEPHEAVKNYRLGRIAEVDYVLQFAKHPIEGLPDPSPVCIEIRLGETVPWKVKPLPSYFTSKNKIPSNKKAASSPKRTKPWWAFWRD